VNRIRINLTDGTSVETSRHTRAQVLAAKDARVGILVGGAEELTYAGLLDEPDVPAERTIQPDDIASVDGAAAP
jgi:hypothetical protein